MHGRLPHFAIVNPLTLVGKELRSILHQRGTLFSHIELIDTTGENEGTLTEVADEAAVVQPASEAAFAGSDLVFFCGTGVDDERWRDFLGEARVIDLTGSLPDATPVVVGVNAEKLPDAGTISSPHPVAASLALLLAPLSSLGGIESVVATVLLSASMHDQKGIDELFGQTVAALNMQSQPREVFDRQLAFNIYPYPDAEATELRIVRELADTMGAPLPVVVSLLQATTFHGMSMSVWLRFESDADAAAARAALGKSPAVDLREHDGGSSTIDSAGIDEILVGRIQSHPDDSRALTIWATVDNLRRGTALNAALIAEEITSHFAN